MPGLHRDFEGMLAMDAEAFGELRRLNERYFHAVDRRDLDAIGSCFTPAATCLYLGGAWQLSGRRAIVERLSIVDDWTNTVHTPATMDFTGGDDTATGVVYAVAHLLLTDEDAGRYVIVRGLKYSDRYTCTEGKWLIAERRQDPLWQYEVPAVPTRLPGQGVDISPT